ncbi:MAG: hypothetical protein AB7J40_05840 [Candidatus Altimarinota bacterium]
MKRTQSEHPLSISDVGMFRVSKENVVNEGDDGLMWDSERRLAVIADGIHQDNGHGMDDVLRLQNILNGASNTREDIRACFWNLAGPETASTMVALHLPESFDRPGLLLHAGDSHCVRISRATSESVLDVLTTEHSLWEFLHFSIHDDRKHFHQKYNQRKTCQAIASAGISVQELVEDIEFLGDFLSEQYLDPQLDLFFEEWPYDFLVRKLYRMIFQCRSTLILTMMNTPAEIRHFIGDGKDIPCEDGDRIALMTDGIYADVLTDDELRDILLQPISAQETAQLLVSASQRKKIKTDDRAAIVLDLAEGY